MFSKVKPLEARVICDIRGSVYIGVEPEINTKDEYEQDTEN